MGRLTSDEARALSRLAHESRDSRRAAQMSVAIVDRVVERLLLDPPPLTDEQRRRLAVLLAVPVDGSLGT